MGKAGARRVLREIAWLAVAVAVAFLVAGEIVHRAVWVKWLPWSTTGRGPAAVVMLTDRHGQCRVLARYHSQLVTGSMEMPSQRGGRAVRYSEQHIVDERVPDELRRALDDGMPFDRYVRVGWPLRFASCFTLGTPPDTIVDTWGDTPPDLSYSVSRGLATIGLAHLATRPLMPGFLVVVTVCEGVVLSGRAAAWLPRWRRRRSRARGGLCERCGYDLAGLTDGACPECGEGRA